MVAAFDRVFGAGVSVAATRTTADCGDASKECSLDSLVDLAYLLVSDHEKIFFFCACSGVFVLR